MGKVSHRTIKQFFFSNSDQSWNIKKKKKEILAQVSCIIYKVTELLLSEFSLSFLFHQSRFSPIANHVSHCHFPSSFPPFSSQQWSLPPSSAALLQVFPNAIAWGHLPGTKSHFSGGEHAAVGGWKVARGPLTPPAMLQEGAEWWCQQRAVRGLGCLFNTWKQPLLAGKQIWRRKVAPPGLNQMIFHPAWRRCWQKGLCHHRWETFGW